MEPINTTLKQRVLRAGAWSLVGFALSWCIRLGSNLLMTRLLAPEMFGVMAIASTLVAGLGMLSDLGLRQSIVQSPDGDTSSFLNTAWIIQIVRGFVLSLAAVAICLMILLAQSKTLIPTASVYADASLPWIISALAVCTFVSSFDSTKLYEASRKILLREITKIDIVAQFIGFLSMVAWVSVDRSIWVLVVGSFGSAVTRLLLSHCWLNGSANKVEWDPHFARQIYHFGKWILLSSVLGFLVNNGDKLLLGWLVGTRTLGLYAIASLLVGALEGALSKIMGDVAFPAFSEVVRSRPQELRSAYYRLFFVIAAISMFASGFLMVSGTTIVSVLYDPRYHQAGWMLQLLSSGLLAIPYRLATFTFLALGIPKIQSHVNVIRFLFLFLLTPILFEFYDIEGAIITIVMSQFTTVPFLLYYNYKNRLLEAKKEFFVLVALLVGVFFGAMFNLAIGQLFQLAV